MSITAEVASFVLEPQFDSISTEVDRAVRMAMLDSIGVSVAGSRHPATMKLTSMITAISSVGKCQIIGSNQKTDAVNAALVNGLSAHVLDWDDTILPTRAHLSAAILPPLIAVGELFDWTLQDLIPAFAVGFEVAARINHAVYPSVHLRGWQGTGIAGGIGAAAALSRVMKLDVGRTVHAMGIAAANASGPIATFGSMTKALNIGRAGAAGVQSAILAHVGFTANLDFLGKGRFLETYAEYPDYDIVLHGLGRNWSILENGYKPYPCGFVAHAMIDAVIDLRAQARNDSELTRLRLRVSLESIQLMGNDDPANELEAKFSLMYMASVAWLDGQIAPAAFEPHSILGERYRAIMSLIEISAEPDVQQFEARADATFTDGSSIAASVAHARGTAARPLTQTELLDKFASAMASGGIANSDGIAALILEGQDRPVDELIERLRPTGHGGG